MGAYTVPPQLYEVTTETGMPHLEENLRYTVRTRSTVWRIGGSLRLSDLEPSGAAGLQPEK